MISLTDLFLFSESRDSPPWREYSRFIIHEHHAERAGLHYDIRIEHEDKLKSWATRKLIELVDQKQKRIALFEQPDHDMVWYDWEGTITDGYGKGKVDIWDKGECEIIKWTPEKKIIDFKNSQKNRISGKYVIIFYENKQHLMLKMKN